MGGRPQQHLPRDQVHHLLPAPWFEPRVPEGQQRAGVRQDMTLLCRSGSPARTLRPQVCKGPHKLDCPAPWMGNPVLVTVASSPGPLTHCDHSLLPGDPKRQSQNETSVNGSATPCPARGPRGPCGVYLACPSRHLALLRKGPYWHSGRERERGSRRQVHGMAGPRPRTTRRRLPAAHPRWRGDPQVTQAPCSEKSRVPAPQTCPVHASLEASTGPAC